MNLAPHVLIRTIRNRLGMTQAQLAKRAGIPQSHLAKIETGKVDVQLSTLRKILRAMFCETVLVAKFQKMPQAAIAERAREVARERVGRIAETLTLEGRRPDHKTIQNLIRSEEARLLRLKSSEIWKEIPTPLDSSWTPLLEQSRMKNKRAQMPLRIIRREEDRSDLKFWLGKSPEERIEAVEFLRTQYYALSGHKTLPRLAQSIQLRGQRP